jgi:Fe-S cluster assembly protein SufD
MVQDPVWVQQLRAAGQARFDALGFPTNKQEAWRFTSVAPIASSKFEPAARVSGSEYQVPGEGALRLVFVNGHFAEQLSRVGRLPAGVRVESLLRGPASDADVVRAHLAKHASYQDQPFAALNTASLHDGAFVYVPPQVTLPEPIELVFLTAPAAAPQVAHPRTLIVVEREARATIVETYDALSDGVYWTNAVTEVVAGDGARVDCYRVQQEGKRSYHIATTAAHQGRDSMVRLHSVAFGGALARHDVRGTLAGPGGSLVLNGLYLLAGQQHTDHHTTIDHAAPHCESHEYFNGVLDDASRGVFTGKIVVRPGAQNTDSKQTNNNLLLSDRAHADSQPQLEIYADDVKCTHGSTVGPLDPKALFYLESRGIGATEARRLMTYGFAAEILNRMDVAPLREQLDRIVRDRLAE